MKSESKKKRYEQMRAASAKYDKNNTKHISLKLNKNTDADILEWLEGIENKNQYFKTLVREDMERKAD